MVDIEVNENQGLRPWFRRLPVLSGTAFAVALVAGIVGVALLIADGASAGGYVATACALGGIALSRRHAWAGLLLVLAGVVLNAMFWDPLLTWTIAVFIVFVIAIGDGSGVTAGLLTGAVAYVASVYAGGGGLLDAAAISGFLTSVTAAAVGTAIRNRDRYWTEQDGRARDALAAGERDFQRRVIEERLRIARDLHDVVGHEVAVISMNLGVAEVSLPAGSQKSRAAIDAARRGVQAVLSETQSILAVLRESTIDAADNHTVPGVGRLTELVDSFRSSGLTIDAQIDLNGTPMNPTADVAVYRVVQEALTNAHRHGSGVVRLRVFSTMDEMVVEVSNDIRATYSLEKGSGLGLIGMRERLSSAGGSLDIDARGGSFSVCARVPTGMTNP